MKKNKDLFKEIFGLECDLKDPYSNLYASMAESVGFAEMVTRLCNASNKEETGNELEKERRNIIFQEVLRVFLEQNKKDFYNMLSEKEALHIN